MERIEIPDEFFVALKTPREPGIPASFMAPNGTTIAAKKRIRTATNASQYGNVGLGTTIIRNEPLCGFTLRESREWGYREPFVVIDPRGFKVNFTAQSLRELLQVATIDRGEIVGRAVWAKRGARLVLVPEGSDDYETAMQYTSLQSKKFSLRDIKIGNIVYTKNGKKAEYLGFYYPIDHHPQTGLVPRPKRHHHFRVLKEDGTDELLICGTISLAERISDAEKSSDDALAYIAAASAKQRNAVQIVHRWHYLTSCRDTGFKWELEYESAPLGKVVRDQTQRAIVAFDDKNDDALYWRMRQISLGDDHVSCAMYAKDAFEEKLVLKPTVNGSLTPFAYNRHRASLPLSSHKWFFVKVTLIDENTGTKTTSYLR